MNRVDAFNERFISTPEVKWINDDLLNHKVDNL